MLLRVRDAGRGSGRLVAVRRPFALVGDTADSDVRIRDRDVDARHAYLHLDPRGVFAVDLATRTGTRFRTPGEAAGWLAPGDRIEIAGTTIELLEIRDGGQLLDPPACDDDPLDDARPGKLVGVALEPRGPSEGPWLLGSELIFLGWSSSCGIRVRDASVAKVHCALVRTAGAAYVVDLCGRHTLVEGRPVRGASILADGQSLTIGATPFTVRVGSPDAPSRVPAPNSSAAEPPPLLARVLLPEVEQGPRVPALNRGGPAESPHALMAWMIETIRETQGELARQQAEMQKALAQWIGQLRQDNATLLNVHLARIESLDRELTTLRAQLPQHADGAQPPLPLPLPPPPQATPLQVAPRKGPRPVDSKTSASWLVERSGRIEDENRSAWKNLLNRLSSTTRPAP